MAARALASVTVTFGMVSIPVKLYAATAPHRARSFRIVNAADFTTRAAAPGCR